MEESILKTIKKLVGILPDDDTFDLDIIVGINTAFSILCQVGIGPKSGFSISDETAVWSDIIPDWMNLANIKTFVQIHTKLVFDTPSNSSVTEFLKNQADEILWRILVEVENIKEI